MTTHKTSRQQLQCMEIMGGNQAVRDSLSAPGMDIWLDSRPFESDPGGGDVHYLSVCGTGRVTRLAIADVSGHGHQVDDVAKWLRKLMRKHINQLDQTRLARDINREFAHMAKVGQFATALMTTYFAPTDHLIVCNAGHPRPIWYSTRNEQWNLLDHQTAGTGPSLKEQRVRYRMEQVSNLPLGVIDPTEYHQFAVHLDQGDLVLIYTDALMEARNPQGQQLGEQGLVELARQLDPTDPISINDGILSKVDTWRAGSAPDDDQTLIVMYHNASDPPKMTAGQAVKSLTKMLGLSRV